MHSGSDGVVSEGGCSISSAGGCFSAKWPGPTAPSPTTVPSARTSPTVPGCGLSGSSSRAPKIVVVESNPGTEATRTATMSSCAHSFVEFGHRPETTNPLSDPRAWKGATSTAGPWLLSIWPPRYDSGPDGLSMGHAIAARNRTRGVWTRENPGSAEKSGPARAGVSRRSVQGSSRSPQRGASGRPPSSPRSRKP